jgi:hypothetical protein
MSGFCQQALFRLFDDAARRNSAGAVYFPRPQASEAEHDGGRRPDDGNGKKQVERQRWLQSTLAGKDPLLGPDRPPTPIAPFAIFRGIAPGT